MPEHDPIRGRNSLEQGLQTGVEPASEIAVAVLRAEALALQAASTHVRSGLSAALRLLLAHSGKILATGLGKSGYVAAKMAATFSSTGVPAVFLHPVEALHGDIGVCQKGDAVIFVSKSGATPELLALVPAVRQLACPMIGILGNPASPLAREMDIVIPATVRAEADPWNLIPTASAAVAMALGDALAVGLAAARGFRPEQFARVHPNGQLGRNLRLKVADAMHTGDRVAWVAPETPLKQVVIVMTERPLGAACVLGPDGRLAGLITDGDLRRALRAHDDIRDLRAADIMTRKPVTIAPDATLHEALRLMEDRPSQISVLPVVDHATGRCLGLLRLHDIYQAESRLR